MKHTVTQTYEVEVNHVSGIVLPQEDPYYKGLLDSAAELSNVGDCEGTLWLLEDDQVKWWNDEPIIGPFHHCSYSYEAYRIG